MKDSLSSLHTLVYEDPRLKIIESDFWIGYTNAKKTLDTIEYYFSKPMRKRPQNIALIGDTNNGKTMIIDRFCRLHPNQSDMNVGEIEMPILLIEQPSSPDEKRLYDTILSTLGLPCRPTESIQSKLETIVTVLSSLKTKMIVIDEFHKMLAGSPAKQRQHLNGIRSLGNRLMIPFLIAGTHEARSALMADPELANRFDPIFLEKWEYGQDFRKFLASLEKVASLNHPSNLSSPELSRKIFALSEGVIGEIVNLIRKSMVQAIISGEERITSETIDRCGWVMPSHRQRRAE